MRDNRRGGRLRPVLPDQIDEIGFDGRELDARLGERLGQPLDFLDGVKRRIVAERRALAELLGDPARWLGLGRLQHLEQRRVGLGAGLQRVASIDEQRCLLLQYDRYSGRSGEAREPGQALELGGEIFVLVFVAMGNEKAFELSRLQLALQRLDALAAGAGGTHFVEKLKHGGRCTRKTRPRSIFDAGGAAADNHERRPSFENDSLFHDEAMGAGARLDRSRLGFSEA